MLVYAYTYVDFQCYISVLYDKLRLLKLFSYITSFNAVMVYLTHSVFQYRLFVPWEKNRSSCSQELCGIAAYEKISQNNISRTSAPVGLLLYYKKDSLADILL